MSGPTDIRAGRYADNEAAYRRINERIRRYEERDGQHEGDPTTFLCECAEGACIEQIPVTLHAPVQQYLPEPVVRPVQLHDRLKRRVRAPEPVNRGRPARVRGTDPASASSRVAFS